MTASTNPSTASDAPKDHRFKTYNRAFADVFQPNELSLGLVVPLEAYPTGPTPSLERHVERIQLADSLGFAAVWLRDIPFTVPSFGDAGQVFDPLVYLGLLAGATDHIALGVASLILPLRHPAHVAKAAATANALSDGRLLLGIASGDRPAEYPALNIDFERRGELFRSSVDYIRQILSDTPTFSNPQGTVGDGLNMGPKPNGELPLLVTGSSQQDDEWIAQHSDGWMTYPRPVPTQRLVVSDYRSRVASLGLAPKPVVQPFYVDIVEQPLPNGPEPIHLGSRFTIDQLRTYIESCRSIGINHLALNLRFNRAPIESTLKRLATELLP